jgi:hypothetical protein
VQLVEILKKNILVRSWAEPGSTVTTQAHPDSRPVGHFFLECTPRVTAKPTMPPSAPTAPAAAPACAACYSRPPRAAHAAPPPLVPPLSPLSIALTSKGDAKPHFTPPLSLLALLPCCLSSAHHAARQVAECIGVASSFLHLRSLSVSDQSLTRAVLKCLR